MTTSMTQYINPNVGLSSTGHKIKALKPNDYIAIMTAARDMGYRKATARALYVSDRDQLIMRILYECGTRVSSTLQMDIDTLDRRDGTLRFEQQKKKRFTAHELAITETLKGDLLEYMVRHAITIQENGGKLFGITRAAFDARLKVYSKEAGIPITSAHAFRHGCAMNLMAKGMPIHFISFHLGHSSVAVTAGIYANVNTDIERAWLAENSDGEYTA